MNLQNKQVLSDFYYINPGSVIKEIWLDHRNILIPSFCIEAGQTLEFYASLYGNLTIKGNTDATFVLELIDESTGEVLAAD